MTSALPHIPEGARLSLRPGEWYAQPGVPEEKYVDLYIAEVRDPEGDSTMETGTVWVFAHGLECRWPSATPHPPCFEVPVSVEGIRRAVADRAG